MCGRQTFRSDPEVVADEFDLPATPKYTPRYNIAPTQPVPIVGLKADSAFRGLAFVRWGLVPYWSTDLRGPPLINVRGETVAGKFAFQFFNRRCLMAADGFYEWTGGPGRKRAHYFTVTDREVFAFAAVWDVWKGADGPKVVSAALLTTMPNELVGRVHNRMPVILPRSAYDEWLDPETPERRLGELLVPYPAELMAEREVGYAVNNPRNDGPECLDAA